MPTFVSKYRNYGVTIKTAGLPMMDEQGRIGAYTPGERAIFNNGKYYTADPEVVEWLRSRPGFNVEFWELGQEPGVILPALGDLLDQITLATARNKPDRLREILAAERDTHNRDEVIRTAEVALNELTAGAEGRRGPGRPPSKTAAAA